MTATLAAIRLALRALVRAKLRSALTILGILIGVAAVVIVVALGSGVQQQVMNQISSLGANIIYIFPQSTQASGVRSADVNRLTESDGRALLMEATSIADVAPFSSTGAQVVSGESNAVTQVMGVSRSYFRVRGFSVAKGQMFTESEELLKAKVCIIGETVREKLFGAGDPIGQYVRIGRHPYRVVGLLAKKGQALGGDDQDDRVLMPIGSFRARVAPSPPGRVE